MYRKNVFSEIGAFDENLWPGEDVDLDYRLKKKNYVIMNNSKAIVYHYRPESLKELLKMMYRYGVTQGILTKKYGFFRRIQIIPILFILLILLAFINQYWLIPLLICYLLILVKLKSFIKGNFIIMFFGISFLFWTLGFLVGLVKLKR